MGSSTASDESALGEAAAGFLNRGGDRGKRAVQERLGGAAVEALRRADQPADVAELSFEHARDPGARIVNVSSAVGSLALNADPSHPYHARFGPIYPGSKAAENAVTLAIMVELESTPIKVNLVSPAFTATNLNAYAGTESVEDGSREVVRVALLGPTVRPAPSPAGKTRPSRGEAVALAVAAASSGAVARNHAFVRNDDLDFPERTRISPQPPGSLSPEPGCHSPDAGTVLLDFGRAWADSLAAWVQSARGGGG